MDEKQIIERIKTLCAARRWSTYRLAKESGITYSTLCTMLNKSHAPSIPTLMKLCIGLGISLSEFFDDGNERTFLSDDETSHLQLWKQLNQENQHIISRYMTFLLSEQE